LGGYAYLYYVVYVLYLCLGYCSSVIRFVLHSFSQRIALHRITADIGNSAHPVRPHKSVMRRVYCNSYISMYLLRLTVLYILPAHRCLCASYGSHNKRDFSPHERNIFPVKYELDFYILVRWNSGFKAWSCCTLAAVLLEYYSQVWCFL
jgi:hypothetical protein